MRCEHKRINMTCQATRKGGKEAARFRHFDVGILIDSPFVIDVIIPGKFEVG